MKEKWLWKIQNSSVEEDPAPVKMPFSPALFNLIQNVTDTRFLPFNIVFGIFILKLNILIKFYIIK